MDGNWPEIIWEAVKVGTLNEGTHQKISKGERKKSKIEPQEKSKTEKLINQKSVKYCR